MIRPLGVAIVCSALFVSALAAGTSEAQVPSPTYSTMDNVIVGNMNGFAIQSTNGCVPRPPGFTVVVNASPNVPVAFALVVLDFSSTAIHLGSSQNSGTTVNCPAKTLSKICEWDGVASFSPRFGGFSNSANVHVSANSISLGDVRARSTDIDAQGGTTQLSDFILFAQNFGVPGAGEETNFDACSQGSVGTSLADFSIFARDFMIGVTGIYCP